MDSVALSVTSGGTGDTYRRIAASAGSTIVAEWAPIIFYGAIASRRHYTQPILAGAGQGSQFDWGAAISAWSWQSPLR